MISQTCITLSIRIFLKWMSLNSIIFFRQQILLVRRDDHVCKCLLHPVFAISRHVREAPVPTERKPHNGATPSDRPLDKNTIVAAFPYVPGLYNHLSHSLHSGTTKTSCGPLLRWSHGLLNFSRKIRKPFFCEIFSVSNVWNKWFVKYNLLAQCMNFFFRVTVWCETFWYISVVTEETWNRLYRQFSVKTISGLF